MQGSVVNRIYEGSRQPVPEVGMGVTITHYSDRSAATIVSVKVKDGEVVEFETRPDKTTRTDQNGMSDAQTYEYEPGDPSWPTRVWRKNKRGRWCATYTNPETGRLNITSSPGIALGVRDKHYDYSF